MYALKKVLFIKNALVLTATALLLRLAGIIFKVWLAAKIGSEGIGLYQLVISLYVLVSTFATGGISTAVTRMVTDELALGSGKGALRVLKKGIAISLLLATASLAVTFFGADFLAKTVLGDLRAAPAIKILGFSLPFMGISSCIRGYFMARRKTLSSGLSQILEQTVRILIVVALSVHFAERGLSFACAAVLFGDTVAEAVSCAVLYLSMRADRRKIIKTGKQPLPHGIHKIIHISLPITSGKYLNSALRTAENVIMPKALAAFGAAASALSQFGMIKGMALPLLFFPSSFLNSVSTLLIPEMGEALSCGQKYKIKYITQKVMTITSASSFLLAGIFFSLSYTLGNLIYSSTEVGYLLRVLAPIVPLMYIDSMCDGMLKGLDQQGFIFRISVLDSALRIVLILFIVPRFGMNGFLFIMVISNLFTAALRVSRLLLISEVGFDTTRWVIKPLLFSFLACAPIVVFKSLSLPTLIFTVVSVAVTCAIYVLLCFAGGCVSTDDLTDLFK